MKGFMFLCHTNHVFPCTENNSAQVSSIKGSIQSGEECVRLTCKCSHSKLSWGNVPENK